MKTLHAVIGILCVAALSFTPLIQAETPPADAGAAAPAPYKPTNFGETVAKPTTIIGRAFVTDHAGNTVEMANLTIWACGAEQFDGVDDWILAQIADQLKELRKKIKLATDNKQLDLAKKYGRELTRLREYHWDMVPACPHTVTDAKGNFRLTHNLKSPYLIFASGELPVGDQFERYHWILSSEEVDFSRPVILSGANAGMKVHPY